MSGLGLTFLRRGGQAHPTAGTDYILSETKGDPEVFRILMSKGISSDGVGITKDDAAAVTSIGQWFAYNKEIRNFPELIHFTNVTTIEENAFRECENLLTIDLTNVQYIGQMAFALSNLSHYDLEMPNFIGLTAVNGGKWSQIFYKSQLRSVKNLGSCQQIPDGIYSVSIVYSNFGLTGVNSVHINENMRYIGYGSFYGCKNLTEVIIEEGTTEIGESSFGGCNIQRIVIPKSVGTIRALAFVDSPMEYAIVRSETPPTLVNVNAFMPSSGKTYPIYVPDESVAAYQSANVWSGIASRIKPLSELNG